jgi:hypothetical protein
MAALRLVSCENKEATDTRGRGVVLNIAMDTLPTDNNNNNNNNKWIGIIL